MTLLRLFALIIVLISGVPAIAKAEPGTELGPTTDTVTETMVSGGYLYMRLEEQGIWVATSPLPRPVAIGDQIEYTGGMEMRAFYSKTLDRTFESIYFIQNVKRGGQTADAMHAAAMNDQAHSESTIAKPEAAAAPTEGEIKHLSDGKTVADIFAAADQLKGQTVSINARVIKVSKNIVGKNWITLQDGTGSAPADKLLATSQELVAPGDTVVATGIVRTNIDIGSGYKYNVVMEDVVFSAGVE